MYSGWWGWEKLIVSNMCLVEFKGSFKTLCRVNRSGCDMARASSETLLFNFFFCCLSHTWKQLVLSMVFTVVLSGYAILGSFVRLVWSRGRLIQGVAKIKNPQANHLCSGWPRWYAPIYKLDKQCRQVNHYGQLTSHRSKLDKLSVVRSGPDVKLGGNWNRDR